MIQPKTNTRARLAGANRIIASTEAALKRDPNSFGLQLNLRSMKNLKAELEEKLAAETKQI